MPSLSRILRGLHIQGQKTYYPRLEIALPTQPAEQENAVLPDPAGIEKEQDEKMRTAEAAIREEAEKLRREILAEAAVQANLLEEKAREEGFQKGLRQGEEVAEELLQEARQILKNADRRRREILAEAEPEIIQIALNIAEKLLDYKVKLDSCSILAMIARGLNILPAGQKVYIRCNPLHEKACRNNFHTLREMLKGGTQLELGADKQIPPGSFLLETEEAEVEFLLQKELQILGEKLLALADPSREEYMPEEAAAVGEVP